MRRSPLFVVLLALAALVVVPEGAPAQGIGELRRRAAEAKRVADALKKAQGDSAKAKATADSGKRAATADSAKATGAAAAPAAGAPSAAGVATPAPAEAKVWENYDFVPGNKVIFYSDFSDDRVGNFARRLKYISGPVEVVERDGVKVLRSTGRGAFLIPVGKRLPERFTLEVDILAPQDGGNRELLVLEGGPQMDRGDKSAEITWQTVGTYIQGSGQNVGISSVRFPEAVKARQIGQLVHIRVLMDSAYFKMYVNERRVYNIPELHFQRDSVIHVFLHGVDNEEVPTFVTRIRVAESETDVLYDALAATGRWATQGILFATGKAELQPESRPVLKEIASTLKEHADLKVLIEGHTDNVGAAAANLALSDARAAAVKAALVADFGVDGSRITTRGLGDTKPSTPNTTAEGRAQNRRVEVVKQ